MPTKKQTKRGSSSGTMGTRRGSSTVSMTPPERKKCCRWPWILLTFILLGVAGFCVWYFVPFGNTVSKILPDFGNETTLSGGGGDDSATNGGGGGSTPPPTFAPPSDFTPCPPDKENCCNGVDGLCDLPADEILFATSHNSYASADEGFRFGPNHKKNLEQSLRAGIRGLMLDVCSCGGQIELCHGLCGVGDRSTTTVFTNIKDFMEQNPTEILIISMQIDSEAGDEVDLFELRNMLESTGVTSMLYQHPGRETEWPTLGELRESGKRILLFHFNSPNECRNGDVCPDGFNYYFEYAMETHFQYDSVDDLLDYDFSCQPRRGAGNSRNFYGINNFVLPNKFPSQAAAEQVNQAGFLKNTMNNCKQRYGLNANLLIIDFWAIGGLISVTQEHNEALVARRRKSRRLGQ